MPTLKERVQGAIDAILKDQGLFHQVVHGDKTTEVTTEGGKVKSLAKAVGDLETSATRSATAAAGSATQSAGSATSAAGSASTATTQASNAAQSATAAAGSATAAKASATKAGASESAAATSATGAAASQTAAQTSESNAAASAAQAYSSASTARGRIATKAQAEKGTDNNGLMTPERTAQAIAKQGWRPTVRRKSINVKKTTKTLSVDVTDLDLVTITPEADLIITLTGGYWGQRVLVMNGIPPWVNKGVPVISEMLVNVGPGDPVPPSGNYPTLRKRLLAGEYAEFAKIGGYWDNWKALGDSGASVPVGTIIRYPTNKPPFGWFYCDGSQVYNVMYRELANAMGLPHGAVQYRKLTIPDLRTQGHFIIKY